MLEHDQEASAKPGVISPPPPWVLTGRGLIALYAPAPDAALGALLLLRYAESPVGPYDELLWLTFGRSPVGWRPQVRAIVVSTPQSVEGGRRNWELPKRLARFAWAGEGRRGQVRVTGEKGQPLAHLAFRTDGLHLPVTTALLPPALRTLAQPPLTGQGGWTLTQVRARGHLGLAHLMVRHAEGLHPPLNRLRPRLTLEARNVRLVFPVPEQA